MKQTTEIVLVHGFDPRGNKIGGLETYCRDFIKYCPSDCSVTVVGVDSKGDLNLGEISHHKLEGHSYAFIPVARYPENEMAEAASKIRKSLTATFITGIARCLPRLAKTLPSRATFDLRRVETAFFPNLLRRPYIQMIHGDGVPKKRMDSMLARYPFVHQVAERISIGGCYRFLCVNPIVTTRKQSEYPKYKNKIHTLTTWADPKIFTAQPFQHHDDFRIVFCGRLDSVKRPDLMFRSIAHLQKTTARKLSLHLVGANDPSRYLEYNLVKNITVLHGPQRSDAVHEIIQSCDCGILTSEFEGMPRFVLETLATGRPVVATNLPQLREVVKENVSGFLVEPNKDEAQFIVDVADRLKRVASSGSLDPFRIADTVAQFRPEILLEKVYQHHRELAAR